MFVINGQHVHAEARETVAGRALDGVFIVRITFRKRGVKEPDDRNIQPVEPDHRGVGMVAVVVPGHWRCDDEITVLHQSAFAIDRSVCTGTVKHEPQRRLAMAVGRGHLARQYQLQPGIKRGCDLAFTPQPWIFQNQNTPLCLFGRYKSAGLQKVRLGFLEVPKVGAAAAFWLLCDDAGHDRPKWRQCLLVDLFIERLAFRGLGRCAMDRHAIFLPSARMLQRWC